MATTEVSNMVKLANEASQCLGGFNLDVRRVYDQVFNLLCLWRKFWMWKTPCRNCHPVLAPLWSLKELLGTRSFVRHISQVVEIFNDVSRNIDGIKFAIKKVTLILDELNQELAK